MTTTECVIGTLGVEFGVLGSREADEIRQPIVGAVPVEMMDVPSLRHRAVLGFPLEDVFSAVFVRSDTDENVALHCTSATLPSIVPGALRLESHVVALYEAARVSRVHILRLLRRSRDSRCRATTTLAFAGWRSPSAGRSLPRELLHLTKRWGSIPVRADERSTSIRVLLAPRRKRETTSTSACRLRHARIVPRQMEAFRWRV